MSESVCVGCVGLLAIFRYWKLSLRESQASVAGWIGFQVGWNQCSSPKGHPQIMNCWPWRKEGPSELTCPGCFSLLVVGLARAGF